MGMVRCPYCKTVFNALANLVEFTPSARAVPPGAADAAATAPAGSPARPSVAPAIDSEAAATASPPVARPPDSAAAARTSAAQDHPGYGEVSRLDETLRFDLNQLKQPNADVSPYVPPADEPRIPARASLMVALRNILRHRRRTLLSLAPICFGVVALIVASGFIDFMKNETRERRIHSHLGHIQIVKPGYIKRGEADPYAFVLPAHAPVLDYLASNPRVLTIAPRLKFSGLISMGDTTLSFLGEGVDPAAEGRLSTNLEIIDGRNLDAARTDELILGNGLARNLGASTGDTLVLLGKTEDGGLSAVEAEVVGIFQTPIKAYDDAYLRGSMGLANQLTRTEGPHKWVVLLDRTESTDAVIADLTARFANAGGSGANAAGSGSNANATDSGVNTNAGTPALDFVSWFSLADFYRKTVVLFDAQVNVIRFMIALIIVASISNTMFMSVKERTSEIGTLMAVGFRRREVLGLFIREGVVLGIVGGLLGIVLGYLVSMLISTIGVPMPPPPGMGFGFIAKVLVSPGLVAGSFAIGALATILASIYPARRAASLNIVDALRHSR